ncbi:acetylajmalan esterase-like [Populus alba x Populus x berolinensis]|nr:acetylajmalan esterase-like [Populus alba x Populus x berolinensis]
MAATKVVLSHVLVVLSCIAALLLFQVSAIDGFESQELKICGFDAIYNIGDSLSNTGNKIRINSSVAESRLPDGTAVRSLVPLDYIVKSAGFSSIKAYLNTNETDSHNGVNFAFSGASTLPAKVLMPKLKVDAGVIVNTLGTQLQWFDRYLKGFCRKPKDCKEKLKSSLFIMGEIGANDYNMAFHFASKTIEEVNRMGLVSDNVKCIKKAIEKVIHYGVTRVLVPGIYRLGCTPGYVSKFAESNTLDKYGCVKEYNDFFNYHNDLLQAKLEKLRKKYPGVSIVYGDYYTAMQFVMDNYKKFGFEYITEGCYIDQVYGKLDYSRHRLEVWMQVIDEVSSSKEKLLNGCSLCFNLFCFPARMSRTIM